MRSIFKRRSSIAFGSAFFVILLLFLALVPSCITRAAGVEVDTVSPAKTSSPGDLVTVVFSVKNTGAAETFDLQLDSPQGWTPVGGLAPLQLAAGEKETVFVTVMVPSDAAAKTYTLTLTATSQSIPSITDSSSTDVTVEQESALELRSIDERKRGRPGEELSFTFLVINKGNMVDRIDLEVKSLERWSVSLSADSVELLPGERSEVTLTVRIPESAEGGARQWFRIVATSTVNRDISDTLRLEGAVIPPPPSAVGESLYPRVPAMLSGSVSLSGDRNRSLDLSVGGTFSPGVEFDFSAGLQDSDQLSGLQLDLYLEETEVGLGSVGVSSALASFTGTGWEIATERASMEGPEWSLEAAKTENGEGVRADLGVDPLQLELAVINEDVQSGSETVKRQVSSVEVGIRDGNLALTGQYGSGSQGREEGSAYRLEASSSSRIAGVSGSYFWGDEGFPGSLDDTTGFSVSSRLSPSRERNMSLSFSHNYSHDNVEQDPTEETVTRRRTRGSLSTAFDGAPNLSASLEHKRTKSTDPTETDKRSISYAFDLGQSLNQWSYSLYYDRTRTIDLAAGTEYVEDATGTTLGLELEGGSLELEVSQNLVEDEVTGAIEERGWRVGLGGEVGREFSFRMFRSDDSTGLGFDYVPSGNPGATFGANMSLSDEGGFIGSVDFGREFATPIKVKETKGQVGGRVFVDANGNGRYDSGDEGVEDLILTMDGSQAATGENGRFLFPPSWPGEYQLDFKELPSGLTPTKELPTVKLEAGEKKEISIPLKQFSVISGIVFRDENENGSRDAGELGIGDVEVVLSDGVSRTVRTNQNGRYSFRTSAGTYQVFLNEASLPGRFELTTPTGRTVAVQPRERVRANFGGYQRARPVLFSPTATFDFTPVDPEVGEAVSFDGSESYDPDGSIVEFKWELGDGTVLYGQKITHSYGEAGTYTVTLILTDDDGQEATISKDIEVLGKR